MTNRRNQLWEGWCVPDYHRRERLCREQRGVGDTDTTDLGGARLRRAVGSNWLSNAVAGRPGYRTGYRLLGNVLRTIART
jgi:hypothetical protein